MADEQPSRRIEDYFIEDRTFPPSAEFQAQAAGRRPFLYDEADADYEAFWARQARELARPGTTTSTRSSSGSSRSPSGSSAAR